MINSDPEIIALAGIIGSSKVFQNKAEDFVEIYTTVAEFLFIVSKMLKINLLQDDEVFRKHCEIHLRV